MNEARKCRKEIVSLSIRLLLLREKESRASSRIGCGGNKRHINCFVTRGVKEYKRPSSSLFLYSNPGMKARVFEQISGFVDISYFHSSAFSMEKKNISSSWINIWFVGAHQPTHSLMKCHWLILQELSVLQTRESRVLMLFRGNPTFNNVNCGVAIDVVYERELWFL